MSDTIKQQTYILCSKTDAAKSDRNVLQALAGSIANAFHFTYDHDLLSKWVAVTTSFVVVLVLAFCGRQAVRGS